MKKLFLAIIYFLLQIHCSKQSQAKLAIKTFKAIGSTLKSPLFKTIGNTIKNPIIKIFSNTIKKSVNMFRCNKSTLKNVGCGLQETYQRVRHNVGSSSLKYFGEKGIKKFKYIAPQAAVGGKQLFKTKSKQNIQMRSTAYMNRKQLKPMINRSAEYMKGRELGSLINMVSKSKPWLPLLFVAGGFERSVITEHYNSNFLNDSKSMMYKQDFFPEIEDDYPKSNSIMQHCRDVQFEPNEKHASTQLWMHNVDYYELKFGPLFIDESASPMKNCTRVRLLTHPEGYKTDVKYNMEKINSWRGIALNCWFKLEGKSLLPDSYDMNDIELKARVVRKAIIQEIIMLNQFHGDSNYKLKANNLYVGGYGEGAAMALHVASGFEETLGGIISLSGFKFQETKTHEANKNTPILLMHGTKDEYFPFQAAKDSYAHNDWIKNPNVKFHPLEGTGHTIEDNFVELLKNFAKDKP